MNPEWSMGLIEVTFSIERSHHRCLKVPEMDSAGKITSRVVLRSPQSTFMSRLGSINTFYTKISENRKFRSDKKNHCYITEKVDLSYHTLFILRLSQYW